LVRKTEKIMQNSLTQGISNISIDRRWLEEKRVLANIDRNILGNWDCSKAREKDGRSEEHYVMDVLRLKS
jgi:hypothetical protein